MAKSSKPAPRRRSKLLKMFSWNRPQEEPPVSEILEDSASSRHPSEFFGPLVTYAKLTFSDGTTISIGERDIVVFVGPNNAGKSATIKELSAPFEGRALQRNIVTETYIKKDPDIENFRRRIRSVSQFQVTPRGNRIVGPGYSVEEDQLDDVWERNFFSYAKIFCRRSGTEERLTFADPARSFDPLRNPPENPLQNIYVDSDEEDKISKYFFKAFQNDLVVDRLSGEKIRLLVGKKPTAAEDEDRLSVSYNRRLRAGTEPLEGQGDGMRSFASLVLNILTVPCAQILMIDEPEAFLHPPQARLIGEFIATESPSDCQIFVATHSTDVLSGLVNRAPDRVKIIRLQRDGDKNFARELSIEETKWMANDPLARYSSLLQGLFYERVIICESDSDCLFYQAILDALHTRFDRHTDVLFVHANGKHRMATLAEALTRLGVPVDVIADLDLLSDGKVLERIIRTLGGDWTALRPGWNTIKAAVEQRRPWLSSDAIRGEIISILDSVPRADEFPRDARAKIESVLRQLSPWDALKAAGKRAMPAGDASKKFNELCDFAARLGLWLVPVGELEGFCRSIGLHGPRWAQQVIQEKDLAQDSELEEARAFVSSIWHRLAP